MYIFVSFINKLHLLTLSLLSVHVPLMSPSMAQSFFSSRCPEQADKKYQKTLTHSSKLKMFVDKVMGTVHSVHVCEFSRSKI